MSRTPPKTVQKVRLRQVRDGRVRFSVDRISNPKHVFEAVQRQAPGRQEAGAAHAGVEARTTSSPSSMRSDSSSTMTVSP